VDDNITDLTGIRDFVLWKKLSCYLVATATDGKEGLAATLLNKPDLIITLF